jgi:hypothetical protein
VSDKNICVDACQRLIDSINNALSSMKTKDIYLLNFLAMGYCELGFSTGIKKDARAQFDSALYIWNDIFKITPANINKRKKGYTGLSAKTLEELMFFLDYIHVYLSSISNSRVRILFLQLHFGICTCTGMPQEVSFKILIKLSWSYLELGFSGRAGYIVSIARKLVKSLDEKIMYEKVYARYLCVIGNTAKWYKHF